MCSVISYFARLRIAKIILWCYLIWYLAMAMFYFDARAALWINSLGISAVIGTALVLSILPPAGLRAVDKWSVLRLFLIPFGVSSFAALIKDRGFVIVFSPSIRENLIAIGACALFIAATLLCKKVSRYRA